MHGGAMSSFDVTIARKARRQHKCQCCYQPIPPGSKYHKVFGVWEGDWYSFKYRPHCQDLVDRVIDEEGEAIDPGDAWWIAEELGWLSMLK